MPKFFLLKRTDGGVSVMHLVNGTVESNIAKMPKAQRDSIVSWREIPESALPADRYFRNAWCDVTPEPVIDIDMTKAREIHRDQLRRLREPRLAALDIEYVRADERGDAEAKSKIATKKQQLRDVTDDPRIAAAQTPEELRAVIPDVLKN